MVDFDTVKYQLWEDIVIQWTTNNINWVDFNPNITYWGTNTQAATYIANQSTSFNLSWFEIWHEVCVWLWMYENNEATAQTNSMAIRWEKSTDWWSSYQLIYVFDYWSRTVDPGAWEWFYTYIWIDWDELRDDSSMYRIRYLQNWAVDHTINFTTSNTSINSTLLNAWYIRIDWSNIHYTDWSKWSGKWYKHTIAYDTSYSSFVWTDSQWYMRLDSTWVNKRIYYIDDYWYKRRTYEADDRFWWASSVWTNSKWYIRTPWLTSADNGYWYLCFVWNNWYKYRIMNWPV